MAMTATSILICVVVLNLHHRDPNAPVPRWLRKLTYDIMSRLVCMRDHTKHRDHGVYQLYEFARDLTQTVHVHENHTELEHSFTTLPEDNGLFSNCDQSNSYTYNRKAPKKKLILEEILEHLQQVTSKLKETDEETAIKAEWKAVAKILDRFFLLTFVSVVILASLFLLCLYPLFGKRE